MPKPTLPEFSLISNPIFLPCYKEGIPHFEYEEAQGGSYVGISSRIEGAFLLGLEDSSKRQKGDLERLTTIEAIPGRNIEKTVKTDIEELEQRGIVSTVIYQEAFDRLGILDQYGPLLNQIPAQYNSVHQINEGYGGIVSIGIVDGHKLNKPGWKEKLKKIIEDALPNPGILEPGYTH